MRWEGRDGSPSDVNCLVLWESMRKMVYKYCCYCLGSTPMSMAVRNSDRVQWMLIVSSGSIAGEINAVSMAGIATCLVSSTCGSHRTVMSRCSPSPMAPMSSGRVHCSRPVEAPAMLTILPQLWLPYWSQEIAWHGCGWHEPHSVCPPPLEGRFPLHGGQSKRSWSMLIALSMLINTGLSCEKVCKGLDTKRLTLFKSSEMRSSYLKWNILQLSSSKKWYFLI